MTGDKLALFRVTYRNGHEPANTELVMAQSTTGAAMGIKGHRGNHVIVIDVVEDNPKHTHEVWAPALWNDTRPMRPDDKWIPCEIIEQRGHSFYIAPESRSPYTVQAQALRPRVPTLKVKP